MSYKTLKSKANEVLAEKTSKITPTNIKEGVSVFGVDGTYTGPRPTMYRYDTINTMNNSTGHEEGDIAVISSVEQQQFQRDSIVTSVNCPKTVVLTNPVTYDYEDSVQWGLAPTNSANWDKYQCGGVLNLHFFEFSFDWMDEEGEHHVGVTYTSNDGETYKIGSGGAEMVTVNLPEESSFGRGNDGTPITWDDRISQFLYIGGSQEIITLYKYVSDKWTNLGKWAA